MTPCAHCHYAYAIRGPLCHMCHHWRSMFDDVDANVPDTIDAFEAISDMLDAASKWGLEVEVIHWAMTHMDAHGGTVSEACAAALMEWDL